MFLCAAAVGFDCGARGLCLGQADAPLRWSRKGSVQPAGQKQGALGSSPHVSLEGSQQGCRGPLHLPIPGPHLAVRPLRPSGEAFIAILSASQTRLPAFSI